MLAGLLGIFFLASNPALAKERIEDKKTHPQLAASLIAAASPIKVMYARSTFYNKDEPGCDSDTLKDKTSTCVKISSVTRKGLGVVAVDPRVIPYGSAVIAPDGSVSIALDTGGDVKDRVAAKELASKKGFSTQSPEYKAPVLDFLAYGQIGSLWDHFIVVPYAQEIPFHKLGSAAKARYIHSISEIVSGVRLAQS